MADYQAPVVVYGLTETLRALDSMDARTRSRIRQELDQAATDVAALARQLVDPQGLSGWKRWRGGYNPAVIAAGINKTNVDREDKNQFSRSYVGVINSTPAGAIWEVAGRKSDGKEPRKGRRRKRRRVLGGDGKYHYEDAGAGKSYGNGRGFIEAIRARGGDASRTVWAAYDITDGAFIRRRVEDMLVREGATTQRRIDANAY